ncbi:MAG: ABC transporter ATP-binding protein [Deltaproteobacteria bacterium]|nr:ABC transporter ATP-binding protein [Deltaproteobacteria bacterium]
MADKLAIDIHDLVKNFRQIRLKGGYTSFKSVLLNPFSGRFKGRTNIVEVLKGLNFQAPPGQMVGVIGRNGSGKSTLLKILAGIYQPTRGRVALQGRISALIELGAGFHPEFSGRENVFLNGTILGLSKDEIRRRFEDIVRFAELEEFIDAPVRTYSSGMYVRLGFSVAVNVNPDILLIDEVMAVGDAGFAAKCEKKIEEFKNSGKTILLVSHDLEEVEKFCHRAVWLNDGRIEADGEPARVVSAYREFIRQHGWSQAAPQAGSQRWGQGPAKLTTVEVVDKDGQNRGAFRSGEPLIIRLGYQMTEPSEDLVFGISLSSADGQQVFGTNTRIDGLSLGSLPPAGRVECRLDRQDLISGLYHLDAAIHTPSGRPHDYWTRACSFRLRSDLDDAGVYRPPHTWKLP